MEGTIQINGYTCLILFAVTEIIDQLVQHGVTGTFHLGRLIDHDQNGIGLLLQRFLQNQQMLAGIGIRSRCIKERKIDIFAKRDRISHFNDPVDIT